MASRAGVVVFICCSLLVMAALPAMAARHGPGVNEHKRMLYFMMLNKANPQLGYTENTAQVPSPSKTAATGAAIVKIPAKVANSTMALFNTVFDNFKNSYHTLVGGQRAAAPVPSPLKTNTLTVNIPKAINGAQANVPAKFNSMFYNMGP